MVGSQQVCEPRSKQFFVPASVHRPMAGSSSFAYTDQLVVHKSHGMPRNSCSCGTVYTRLHHDVCKLNKLTSNEPLGCSQYCLLVLEKLCLQNVPTNNICIIKPIQTCYKTMWKVFFQVYANVEIDFKWITSGIHKAQTTCAQVDGRSVCLKAPPRLGQRTQSTAREGLCKHLLQSHWPSGMYGTP